MSRGQTTFKRFAERHGVEVVTVSLPGNKWVTGLEMTCIRCGHKDQAIGHGRAGDMLPPERALRKFNELGWECRGKKTICPTCLTPAQRQARATARAPAAVYELAGLSPQPEPEAAPEAPPDELAEPTVILIETEEPEMPEPETSNVRDIGPDRAAKRRIHDEIAGNWDERFSRYIGSASDQSIAETLKMPRAWVAEIRADFFGDSGANEDIEQLKSMLNGAVARFERTAEDALKVATNLDTQAREVKELRARLERVEKSVLPRR